MRNWLEALYIFDDVGEFLGLSKKVVLALNRDIDSKPPENTSDRMIRVWEHIYAQNQLAFNALDRYLGQYMEGLLDAKIAGNLSYKRPVSQRTQQPSTKPRYCPQYCAMLLGFQQQLSTVGVWPFIHRGRPLSTVLSKLGGVNVVRHTDCFCRGCSIDHQSNLLAIKTTVEALVRGICVDCVKTVASGKEHHSCRIRH